MPRARLSTSEYGRSARRSAGLELVVLVSAAPLYNGLRPIGEKSEEYLAFLDKALPAARTDGLAMADVAIETQSGP